MTLETTTNLYAKLSQVMWIAQELSPAKALKKLQQTRIQHEFVENIGNVDGTSNRQ